MTRFLLFLAALFCLCQEAFAKPLKAVKATLELTVADPANLEAFEVQTRGGAGPRAPVTDMAVFLFKPGADLNAALNAANGEAAPGGKGLFSARLFVVADGKLYTAARGTCGPWDNDITTCAAGCDGGEFALRRNGAAVLELLAGAIPGSLATSGEAIIVSACGDDENNQVRLAPKTGQDLAVVGFEGD